MMGTVKTITELTADTPAGSPSLTTEFVSGPGYTYSLSEIRSAMSNSLPFITVGVTGSGADYECDGLEDNVQIKQAIDYADSLGGGVVSLLKGIFDISASIMMATANRYNNIYIVGSGKGMSVLKLSTNASIMTFGNGSAGLGIIPKNIYIEGITFDINNIVGTSVYGLILTTDGAVVRDCEFINRADGSKNMLFLGISSGASLSFPSQNFVIDNCVFKESTGTFENVLIAQTNNVRFSNCTFGEKSAGSNVLNYGSYGVSFVSCHFENCSNGVNAHGDTKFVACHFLRGRLLIQADNITVNSCMFEGDGTATAGISLLGYIQSGGEASLESPPANTNVQLKNTKITDCIFKKCNSNAISSGVYIGYSGSNVLSSASLVIKGCTFTDTEWQAIDVKSEYLIIKDNDAKNSGQLGTSTVKYNYVFGGKKVYFSNNRSFDDQGSPTTTTDFFIDAQYVASAIPTQDITISDNNFTIGASTGTLPRYFTGSFTSNKPTEVALRSYNNDLINPISTYAQGNITGATTFTRVNGSTITATATGNVTTTITDGVVAGDTLTLIITQDATGSRTISKPSNVKLVGGAFSPTATANAVDSWTLTWDGTNWREVSRSLNMS